MSKCEILSFNPKRGRHNRFVVATFSVVGCLAEQKTLLRVVVHPTCGQLRENICLETIIHFL